MSEASARHRRLGLWFRGLASALLLGAILAWIEPARLIEALRAPSPAWLVAALLLAGTQVLLSAWRWQLTARLLGTTLAMGTAIREYYLGSFLNQVLPGGVIGDAARAWRHAHVAPSARTAWHAVLIERASGQLVLALCALLTLPLVPSLRERVLGGWGHGAAASAAITGLLLMIFLRRAKRPDSALRRFMDDASRALLASAAWPRQLLVSFALLCSYIAVYLCCARALGVAAPAPLLAALICWVLLAMALPLSLAGWGIREGAAASVWLLAGLPVAEGVAVSILYGLVVFVSTLPGAWFLWRAARAEPPLPVGSGGGE